MKFLQIFLVFGFVISAIMAEALDSGVRKASAGGGPFKIGPSSGSIKPGGGTLRIGGTNRVSPIGPSTGAGSSGTSGVATGAIGGLSRTGGSFKASGGPIQTGATGGFPHAAGATVSNSGGGSPGALVGSSNPAGINYNIGIHGYEEDKISHGTHTTTHHNGKGSQKEENAQKSSKKINNFSSKETIRYVEDDEEFIIRFHTRNEPSHHIKKWDIFFPTHVFTLIQMQRPFYDSERIKQRRKKQVLQQAETFKKKHLQRTRPRDVSNDGKSSVETDSCREN